MSEVKRRKVTIRALNEMKAKGERIAALGVYDSPMAAIADEIGFEMFIIGNSGPMSLFGHANSTTVKPEELLFMSQAVSRVTRYAMVVATLPFMSYLGSKKDAIKTAAKFIAEGGADAVQCHGTRHTTREIAAIVRAGVPVLAHLGLQSVRKTEQSGFGVQGRSATAARGVVEDALAMVDAGAFAVMFELVPAEITEYLKTRLPIPVISLGSGPRADGIYLVSGDAVGFSIFQRPRNAGQFVNVKPMIEEGLRNYVNQARDNTYPEPKDAPHMKPGEFEKLVALIAAG